MDDSDSDSNEEAVEELVDANILRYDRMGALQWHGRPQQHQFKKIVWKRD